MNTFVPAGQAASRRVSRCAAGPQRPAECVIATVIPLQSRNCIDERGRVSAVRSGDPRCHRTRVFHGCALIVSVRHTFPVPHDARLHITMASTRMALAATLVTLLAVAAVASTTASATPRPRLMVSTLDGAAGANAAPASNADLPSHELAATLAASLIHPAIGVAPDDAAVVLHLALVQDDAARSQRLVRVRAFRCAPAHDTESKGQRVTRCVTWGALVLVMCRKRRSGACRTPAARVRAST